MAVLRQFQPLYSIRGGIVLITIALANRKGGNAKTTTAHALGAALKNKGFKVLLVDLDAQANLTLTLGADVSGAHGYSLEVILKEKLLADAIQQTSSGLDVLGSCAKNASADTLMSDIIGKEYRLREALASADGYDYVIIDCPPALGVLTLNALTAADFVLLPCQTDMYSIQAIGQMILTINTVKQYLNHDLKTIGAMLVRYNPRPIVNREAQKMLESALQANNVPILKSTIRECSAIREAQTFRQDIFAYAPRSNAAKDYADAAEEIMEVINNG